DRAEPLWLALRMVQVVLRASPSASDCWSRVTNPASMRDCLSSRIFAACCDFISVTTDVPFRWDERWLVYASGRSQLVTNLFEDTCRGSVVRSSFPRGRACARSKEP